jgi:hypothetical protein
MTTRREYIESVIRLCLDGLETLEVTTQLLDECQVRGGFVGLDYTGFDYRAQRWIEMSATNGGGYQEPATPRAIRYDNVAPVAMPDLTKWNQLGANGDALSSIK